MGAQRLSQWLALRCREHVFQRFLGASNATEAADTVRALLGVKSRAEVDSSPEKAQAFHQQIRLPFSKYMTEQ